MNTNILSNAIALSDHDLLARVAALAGKEREASVELVAHLAALDVRPALYAAEGHGSLFTYCTEVLIAELAPRPDVPSSVRKLPTATPAPTVLPATTSTRVEAATLASPEPALPVSSPPPLLAARRPIIETTSPERYRVQFTIGKESHDKLRRVQALVRREIPDGDPGAIFDRALTLLLERVEKTKLGAAAKPRPRPIRPGADKQLRTPVVDSRDIPRHVQRAVSQRDGGQCGFVSKGGHRCTERAFLEFHHIHPHALGGLATVENISLRCRRHNQYEAELIFGPRRSAAGPPAP